MDPLDMEWKEACDGCGHHLSWIDAAFVCDQECTWCPECAEDAGMVCVNGCGELRRRQRRTRPVGR